MGSFEIKTPEDIKKMQEGGKILRAVKNAVAKKVKTGVSAKDLDEFAEQMILDLGGKSSFKTVPNYRWTTCVNVNAGIVHGIPTKDLVFKKGDVVSIDLGVLYQGFHTDTSITVAIDPSAQVSKMLKVGQNALDLAIVEAKPGKRIYDISEAIEKKVKAGGFNPVRALVGHGVGRELHEEPQIPCFVSGTRNESPKIPVGAVIAIEVMYTQGKPDLVLEDDGWTISTQDGKISALFEETVAVTSHGLIVLT